MLVPVLETVIVYDSCVDPSWAVTTVVISVVVPTGLSVMAPDDEPLATVTPFTLIVAFGSVAVGLTVTDVTLELTAAV